MEDAFGSSPPFSLGSEEEFQLLSAESYELVPRFAGADEQRRAHEPEGSLLSVARWLAEETVRDVG